jgi:uncharacterized coiled-coil DUF342 family protein
MKLTTKADATSRLTLRDDPAYAAAEDKLRELQARAAELERQRSALFSGLSGDAERDELTARANRLLQDAAVPRSSDAERARLRVDLEAVTDELTVTRRAVELQQATVAEARRRVSRMICQRLRPRHRAIVSRIAGALQTLTDALAEERDFREALDAADVDFTTELRPMRLAAGDLTNPESLASLWLRDAQEHGLLG